MTHTLYKAMLWEELRLITTAFSVLPRYEQVSELTWKICEKYAFVRRISIGSSVLGRDIFALRFGADTGGSLYVGAVHALEYVTAAIVMQFALKLCHALDTGCPLRGIDCRRAVLTRPVTLVPMLNPDGVELVLGGVDTAGDLQDNVLAISGGDLSGWSANARGVDLNHNFDAGWHIAHQLERSAGILGPSARRYGGECPESEPETQCIARLCRTCSFGLCLALHTQGEEIYWQYGRRTPPMSALMARMLAASTGYSLARPAAIASHAGLKDWFISRFNRPGFTIECGLGSNPLPYCDAPAIYDRIEEALALLMIM